MKSKFDVVKICGYVIAACGLLTEPTIEQFGFSTTTTTHIAHDIGIVSLIATLIVNIFKNPTPPDGTMSAIIPAGTVPVVAASQGLGPAAAHLNTEYTATQKPLTAPVLKGTP